MFDVADSEVDFDVKERDRLAMLEAYRKNLVSGANSSEDIDESNLRLWNIGLEVVCSLTLPGLIRIEIV